MDSLLYTPKQLKYRPRWFHEVDTKSVFPTLLILFTNRSSPNVKLSVFSVPPIDYHAVWFLDSLLSVENLAISAIMFSLFHSKHTASSNFFVLVVFSNSVALPVFCSMFWFQRLFAICTRLRFPHSPPTVTTTVCFALSRFRLQIDLNLLSSSNAPVSQRCGSSVFMIGCHLLEIFSPNNGVVWMKSHW